RDQRFEIVVAELGRAEERHRSQTVANDGFDVLRREIRARLERGRKLASIAGLERLRTRHRRQEHRAEHLVWNLAMTLRAALIEYVPAARDEPAVRIGSATARQRRPRGFGRRGRIRRRGPDADETRNRKRRRKRSGRG